MDPGPPTGFVAPTTRPRRIVPSVTEVSEGHGEDHVWGVGLIAPLRFVGRQRPAWQHRVSIGAR